MNPKELENIEAAIGLSDNVHEYIPKWEEIPDDFKKGYSDAQKWVKVVNDIFYSGVKNIRTTFNEGIDSKLVWPHLMGVLRSFSVKHEHKMAGIAYLMSLWIKEIHYKIDTRRNYER